MATYIASTTGIAVGGLMGAGGEAIWDAAAYGKKEWDEDKEYFRKLAQQGSFK